jgi:cell cycle sensor histidine kinase DivJ
VFRDVTDRRLADEARESARRAAEKLADSKSQFLATMSHELRTPLNAIIGFSEMLADPRLAQIDGARALEYARIIHGSGQHLLEVVNAILDMSKIEAGMMTVEQEPVSLPAVLRSSVELLGVRAASKHISLTCEVAPDLPEIIGDRRAIKQVLLNLLSNAVKFTPEQGEIAVTLVRDRDELELAVSDTGCGMSVEHLQRIGTPFFQVRGSYDRQHEGTGLGLSVVRGLIGLMGGRMLVESSEGAGTRVAVRLPIAGRARGAPQPIAIETRLKARPVLPPAADARRLSA